MLVESVLFLVMQAQPAAKPPASSQTEMPKVPSYRVEYAKDRLVKKGLDPAEVEDFFDDRRLYRYERPPAGRINWKKLMESILAPRSVERGKKYLEAHKETLVRAQRKYGVAPEHTVAIFRIETNLESFFGDYYAASVLYYKLGLGCPEKKPDCWKKRADQLVALVLYCKQAGEDCHDIKSSHAGAFGIGQLMPMSYLSFAEDGDGDGVIDLFNADDAVMSTAKFLSKHGWKKSREKALIAYYGPGGSRYYRIITLKYARALTKK